MRRFASDIQDDQNYDSFLDIVANLVGILVILIMVIGVRARQVITAAATQRVVANVEPAEEFVTAVSAIPSDVSEVAGPDLIEVTRKMAQERSASADLQAAIHGIADNAERIHRLAAETARERDQLQLIVSAAEAKLKIGRQTLNDDQQIQLAVAKELASSRVRLAKLDQQLTSVEAAAGQTKVVRNRLSPVAKTVFGREEHFRLHDGRLAYVPLNPMLNELLRDVKNKKWKFSNADTLTEVVGPSDGFKMKYTVEKVQASVDTPDGPRMGSFVSCKRVVMEPFAIDLGEPTEVALSAGSRFEQRLATMRPDETTITVWVYPGTYGAFRRLKEYLYQRGYTVAARPKVAGSQIIASSDGSGTASMAE